MSTRAAIGVIDDDGTVKARYVHFDGDDVGPTVEKIIARDGVEVATETLLAHSWSFVDGVGDTGMSPSHVAGVAGYGGYYTDERPQWLRSGDLSGVDYVWVIEPEDGSVVLWRH